MVTDVPMDEIRLFLNIISMSTGAWKHIKKSECPHISEMGNATSDKAACAVCGETNDLRLCLTCGSVHCCESHASHNTEHFNQTGHPFIKPHHCNYDWLWCYQCNAFLE